MTTDPDVPAGWYSDPEVKGSQRFWDGSSWTDQRAPAPPEKPGMALTPAVVTVAIGALIALVSVFLPLAEASESVTPIAENSLLQSGDGVLVILMAVGALITSIVAKRPGAQVFIALCGLGILVFAIYWATGDRLHLTGSASPDAGIFEALDAKIGQDANPGTGLWAAGVAGILLIAGGIMGFRGGRSSPASH